MIAPNVKVAINVGSTGLTSGYFIKYLVDLTYRTNQDISLYYPIKVNNSIPLYENCDLSTIELNRPYVMKSLIISICGNSILEQSEICDSISGCLNCTSV